MMAMEDVLEYCGSAANVEAHKELVAAEIHDMRVKHELQVEYLS
jgi:hypothetical protein